MPSTIDKCQMTEYFFYYDDYSSMFCHQTFSLTITLEQQYTHKLKPYIHFRANNI